MPVFRTLMLASAAAVSLTACKDEARVATNARLPYVDTVAYAPAPDALPNAPSAPIAPAPPADQRYAWAERAYAMDQAFEDVPPDYAFDYDGMEPWAWESQDRWTLYAEPVDAGYRYYYYRPGAEHPYFIRDPDYGYGYDDRGRLTLVYTAAGALLAPRYLQDRAPVAGRYWARASDIRRAAQSAQRRAPDRRVWTERAPERLRTDRAWFQAAQHQADWRAYRQAQDRRDLRRFDAERERRRKEIASLPRAPRQADARRERDEQRAAADHRRENDRQQARADRDRHQDVRRTQQQQAQSEGPAKRRVQENKLAAAGDRREHDRQQAKAVLARQQDQRQRQADQGERRQQAERPQPARRPAQAAAARQEKPRAEAQTRRESARNASQAGKPAADRGGSPGKAHGKDGDKKGRDKD